METEAEVSKNATDDSEVTPIPEVRSSILEVASALQVMISDLIEGKIEADQGMREVLHFAAERLPVFSEQGFAPSSKNAVGTDQTRDGEELRTAERGRHQLRCGDSGSQFVIRMNPSLWSTLPKELIRTIVARLPLPLLISLRRVSLKPNCNINLDDSEFRRLCAQNHTKILALILPRSRSRKWLFFGSCSFGVHNMKSSTWRYMWPSVCKFEYWHSYCWPMASCDGGLVCFAQPTYSRSDRIYCLFIHVINPLTGDRKELPQPCTVILPKMMQLVMDQDTKRYEVILVGSKSSIGSVGSTLVAEYFDSWTRVWTIVQKSSDFVVGSQYRWDFDCGRISYEADEPIDLYGVYDCARGQLLEIERGECWPEVGPGELCVFVEDHLFCLRHELGDPPGVYDICEFQVPMDGTSWVNLKDHRFDPYAQNQRPDELDHLMFLGCKGFLLVVDIIRFNHSPHSYKVAWLYDLATADWMDSPARRDGRQTVSNSTIMCVLQWDAVP